MDPTLSHWLADGQSQLLGPTCTKNTLVRNCRQIHKVSSGVQLNHVGEEMEADAQNISTWVQLNHNDEKMQADAQEVSTWVYFDLELNGNRLKSHLKFSTPTEMIAVQAL